MKEWRDLWPGGLDGRRYSTLNLMAQCRSGGLGYNRAECEGCEEGEWYASSCGDRHCPNCLGPRQAQWSEQVCGRLPDCPHFHVVFTVPDDEVGEFFEMNYKVAAGELFAAAAEMLKSFQKNNWEMEGGFIGVLHTWGSALNWHPHLHVLASAGGADLESGRWKQVRGSYKFPVQAMSEVFGAIMIRRLEELDADREVRWPAGLESVEERRDWRLRLARKSWNIFSPPTLGNTRAVVRYLARYTSRRQARCEQADLDSGMRHRSRALLTGAAFLLGGISGQGQIYNRIVSQKIEQIEHVLKSNSVATIEIDAGSGGRVSLSGTVASETLKATLQDALAVEFGEKEARKLLYSIDPSS